METATLSLQLLEEGCSREDYRAALQTLLKIFRNIKENPQEEKYRKIKKDNKAFHLKVWKYDGAQQFLFSLGWTEVEESIVLFDIVEIDNAVDLLEDRINCISSDTRITQPAAGVSNTRPQREMSEKDKLLADERKKLLEKIKKDKEEKRRIAEQIKADRRETSTREVKDSHARELPFGATVKKFENKGG